MANKKKKKKPQTASRRPTYAKGKRVEPGERGPSGGPSGAARKKTGARAEPGEKKAAGEQAAPQFNLIRRNTIEMKVFIYLLVLIGAAAMLQYPLAIQDATTQYNELRKQYPQELKEFEEKYKTADERKEHEDERPVRPVRPTFQDFLLYQWLFLLLQSAMFAFLGINVQRRTDLRTPVFDKAAQSKLEASDVKDLMVWSLPFAAAALVPPVIATWVGNTVGFIKASDFARTDTWKYSLSYINIAVSNIMLFTFLLVSVLVWVFARYRDRLANVEPHWAALGAATALHFGYIFWISRAAGEKAATAATGAAFLALSLVAVLGYLYWKKGLEYSLLAGAIGFAAYPFLAKLIIR